MASTADTGVSAAGAARFWRAEAAGVVDQDVVGDGEQPRPEAAGVRQPVERAEGQEERFLNEIIGPISSAGVEIEAREDETARPPDQFLERGPVTGPSPEHQGGIGLAHAPSAREDDNHPGGARKMECDYCSAMSKTLGGAATSAVRLEVKVS